MKSFFNKIKISTWPLIFLLLALSLVFLLFLIAEKYIYTIIIFGIIIFVSFKIKVPKFSLVLFILSMLSKLLAIMLIKPPIESDFLVMYQAFKLYRFRLFYKMGLSSRACLLSSYVIKNMQQCLLFENS